MAALKKLSVGAMKPWFPQSNLGESSFTCAFLLEKLRENCEQFRDFEKKFKVVNIRAKDISEGNGYLSRVFKCDVVLTSNDPSSHEFSLLFSVILKQPGAESVESSFQGFADMADEIKQKTKADMTKIITKFHHNETMFYKIFGKTTLQIPKFFGAADWIPEKQNGYILMEYLSNGKFPELHVGLTENQLMSLLRFIIKLQAIALKNESEWKTEFTEVNFGEATDSKFGESCYENVKKGQSENFVKSLQKLERFYTDAEVAKYVSGEPWKELGINGLLIHGDLWTNNVCFKYDYITKQITDEILAVIDWQIVHAGNPLTDVSRVLLMCCNADVRRKVDATIVDWYLENLQKELGSDDKLPFTKNDLIVSKRYSDLENIIFATFMPCIHYQGGNPEADSKREAYMQRLEELLQDKMPMIEEHFPHILK